MKNYWITTGLALSLNLITIATSIAQESNSDIVARLAALGDGVHEIKKNDDGTLKSLKVVGSSRISTVLGKAKGLQRAQKKASMKANAAFVEWIKSEVTSISEESDETILTLQGDGENVKEQGKATEMSKEVIAKKAQGLVRGLTLVAKDQTEDMMTLVYLWSPKKANMAKAAGKANQSDKPDHTTPNTGKVTPKRVVSPGFDE